MSEIDEFISLKPFPISKITITITITIMVQTITGKRLRLKIGRVKAKLERKAIEIERGAAKLLDAIISE